MHRALLRIGAAVAKKGVTLIETVMLIVFVSIAVLGVTVFIVQRFAELNSKVISNRCLYLAQAGIQDAIYRVRFRFSPPTTYGYYPLGLTTVNTGETFRRGGTAADMLIVNSADTAPSSNDIINIKMQKATNSATLAVALDRMVITWTETAARSLTAISIGGRNRWTGTLTSPANCDITNINLGASITPVTRLRFNNTASAITSISIQFILTDGSSKTVAVYPKNNNSVFTIKSTGKVSGSSIYRTQQVDYNLMNTTIAARIDDYDEINTEITSP